MYSEKEPPTINLPIFLKRNQNPFSRRLEVSQLPPFAQQGPFEEAPQGPLQRRSQAQGKNIIVRILFNNND